jgi:hypothetical protein
MNEIANRFGALKGNVQFRIGYLLLLLSGGVVFHHRAKSIEE